MGSSTDFGSADVSGDLISTERALIPSDDWMSTLTLADDCNVFRSPFTFEDHACHARYLLGRVLDFLNRTDSIAQAPSYLQEQQIYAQQWTELFQLLEDWFELRPPPIQVLLFQPAGSSGSGKSSPFRHCYLVPQWPPLVTNCIMQQQSLCYKKSRGMPIRLPVYLLACRPDLQHRSIKHESCWLDKWHAASLGCWSSHEPFL